MISLNSNLYSLLLNEIEKNTSSVFLLKTANRDALEKLYKEKNLNESNHNYFYKNYSSSSLSEPYDPIISLVKKYLFSEDIIDEVFRDINIYPSHKELLKNYLINGQTNRNEEVLHCDYHYEKNRLYLGLFNILNYISKDRALIIFLDNLNLGNYSTILWIKWILSNQLKSNFKIVASIDDYNYYNSDYQIEFDNLIQMLQLKSLIIETNKTHSTKLDLNFKPSDEFSITIEYAHNFFNLFALEEAIESYKNYYNLLKLKNSPLLDFSEVISYLGDSYFFLNDFDTAQEYYESLLNIDLDIDSTYIRILATQKLSMLFIIKGKYTIAENLANQSYKLALKLNNEPLIINSFFLIFLINEKAKYRTTISHYNFEEDFIWLAAKYNKKNMLSYFLTHTYNGISYASPDDEKITYYNQGHHLATELDNQNCIISAHLKTALVYAVRGYYNISIQFYKKVEELLIQMKDYFRLAQTYNGIGYYYLTSGDYKNANIYYDKALKNLKSSWNFDEICMTLINLGLNSLLACNYKNAENCFNIFLSIVNELKIDRLRLSTLSRIYGIIGLNNYYLGNYYRLFSLLSKMTPIDTPIKRKYLEEDDDEFFLYNFLQGLLLKSEGNFLDARKYFKRAEIYLNRIEGSLKCLYPKFSHEYCSLLISLGYTDDAKKIKTNAIDFCIKNNYSFYLDLLRNNNTPNLFLKNSTTHLQWVVEAARQQANIDNLNSKISEINFLNLFQENLSSSDNIKTVKKLSLQLIENRFALDHTILISLDDYNDTFIKLSEEITISKEKLIQLENSFNNINTSFISSRKDSNYSILDKIGSILNIEIYSLVYIPITKDNEIKCFFLGITKISKDILSSEIIINSDNIRILNIAIKQLFETTQRIKGQEKLLSAANTDVLTGLYNRQGFYNNISSFINKDKSDFSFDHHFLIYIDLDNFKFYNDTFGHKIGDNVLKLFANILKLKITSTDMAIRYGGDEFILFLSNSNKNNCTTLIKSIYEELYMKYGFKSEISALLGRDVSIPEDRLLSFSTGIIDLSSNKNLNISELVEIADKAMYKAKKNGKSCYIFS